MRLRVRALAGLVVLQLAWLAPASVTATATNGPRTVRVEVDGIGVDGLPHTDLTVTEHGGTKAGLSTAQMWGPDADPSRGGLREACPGVGAEVCVGEIGLHHVDQVLSPAPAELSVKPPTGTIVTFDRDTCRRGLIPNADEPPPCRVRMVAPQAGAKDANAAVALHVDWDVGRSETTLPAATFEIRNPNTSNVLLSAQTADLQGGTDYAVGIVGSASGGGFTPELSAVLPAGWIATAGGDCGQLVLNPAAGDLIACTVDVTRLEERSGDDANRFVRVEVDGSGVGGLPHADIALTDRGRAPVKLHTSKMWGPDTDATSGLREACPGVGAEVCVGEIGVRHLENVGGAAATLSVTPPAGTVATFDRSTCFRGVIGNVEDSPTCRVRFVQPQTTEAGANAAVSLHVDWDPGRIETALPEKAKFEIRNPNTGEVLLSAKAADLQRGADYAVGLVGSGSGGGFVPELTADLPEGWAATPGGDCGQPVLNFEPTDLVACTVEVTRFEARTVDDNKRRFVRMEVDGAGVSGLPKADIALTDRSGTQVQLSTSGLWGPDADPSRGGLREACPGVGADVCIGEIGLRSFDGDFFDPAATVSVKSPTGTIATFDRPPLSTGSSSTTTTTSPSCLRGRITTTEEGAPLCRLRVVAPQISATGANAAVLLHVDWDPGRTESALPPATFEIRNPNTGVVLLSAGTADLRDGTDYAVGLVGSESGGGFTPMLTASLPAGWVAKPGGDCGQLVLNINPTDLLACTVEVTRLEAYPVPRLSIADASVVEGDSGTNLVPVSLSLDSAPLFPVVVAYTTADGTATAPGDYKSKSGSLTIPVGVTSGVLTVTTIGDTLIEPTETFFLKITSAKEALIARGQATITIVNDDDVTPPVISSKKDVIVETTASKVIVNYSPPPATDDVDGKITASCAPASGSSFFEGTTTVRCVASDRSGNTASSSFSVIVRKPTTSGAVFDAKDSDAPITSALAGHRVEVRVAAGAFDPRAIVHVTFVDSRGERLEMRSAPVLEDGSLSAFAVIPRRAGVGPGEVIAESETETGEYDRAWLVDVRAAR